MKRILCSILLSVLFFGATAQQTDLERVIRYSPLTQQLIIRYYLTNNTGNSALNLAEFHQKMTYNTNIFTFASWKIANRTWTENVTFTDNGIYRTVDLEATSGADCAMDHRLPEQGQAFSYLVAVLVLNVPDECLLPHINNDCLQPLNTAAINDPASPGFIGGSDVGSPNFLSAPSSGSGYRLRERTGGCPGNINNTISYDPEWRLDPTQPVILPVDFKGFSATKNRNTVLLKWETAQERKNRGFEIQRSIGNGDFVTLAFVSTKAPNGESDLPLSYDFTDNIMAKGIVFYRLKQIDADNASRFSEIRSVRGDGIGKILAYPNPSLDGAVTLLLGDHVKGMNIQLIDLQGRVVKSYNRVATNNLVITALETGVYTLRVSDIETGEQSVQKIVVNRK
jgi:Secretion system C-terminal sorting domain